MKKTSIEKLDNLLDSILAQAAKNKVFYGATATVLLHEKSIEKRIIKAYGRTRNDNKGVKIVKDTVFDLASLTKPLCTALCIFSLIENKKLAWTTQLQSVFGDKIGSGLKKITIEQLLSHSSGLIDYKPFYRDFKPELKEHVTKNLLSKIMNEETVYLPGEKCLYSDLGFILLGKLIEKVSGVSLDVFYKKQITQPLNLSHQLFFKPLYLRKKNKDSNIAATEQCPWRNRIIQGEVHDEHCWLMGGISGHAGLFGTAEGVLKLTANILDHLKERKNYLPFSHDLLRQAFIRKYKKETWCMGFDKPSPKVSSAGKYISEKSVGHLGYTGTSFWIDPEKDLIIILLTNRVHPSRSNEKIKEFRPYFHNKIIEELGFK